MLTVAPLAVIDLRGRPSDLARPIARANETIGFPTVTRHGVDAPLIPAMPDVTERFFARNKTAKTLQR